MPIAGEELQLLVENVRDRIYGAPVDSSGLIPSSEPGIDSIIIRDIQRTVSKVETKTRISLYPKRKTDLPKTARIAYEDKTKYIPMGSFPTYDLMQYPIWTDLTVDQQNTFMNDSTLYANGTLPWDLMTGQQKAYLNARLVYIPNKVDDAELIDGKGRSYFKLYNGYVIKVHSVLIQIRKPGQGNPYLNRAYTEDDILLYKKEGGIQLLTSMSRAAMMASNSLGMYSTGYGAIVPKFPQALKVDYSYGMETLTEDLREAVALMTAAKVFESVNIAFTKGLTGYSVQGFSANFSKGMYNDVIERYLDEAQQILGQYVQINMTSW